MKPYESGGVPKSTPPYACYIPKSKSEVERSLALAFERLVRAGEVYDCGYYPEALTIAALVYQMGHDHGRSAISLLSQVRRKTTMVFRDTGSKLNQGNMLSEFPLVVVQATAQPESGHIQYLPALGNTVSFIGEKYVRFSIWWDAPVIRDPKRREFSRKNLIFFYRNKMGGGHVSQGYDQVDKLSATAFADLARADPGGWTFRSNEGLLRPEYGVQFATVRQIGWELEQSLKRSCGDLINVGQPTSPLGSQMARVTNDE